MKNSEKFKKDIQELRKKLEPEIGENIQKLKLLISKENPFKLLMAFALKNFYNNLEVYSETPQRIEHTSQEQFVEYVQSIVTGIDTFSFDKNLTEEDYIKIFNLIEEIFEKIIPYFQIELKEHQKVKLKQKIRVESIRRYLFVRGDSIFEHHMELIKIFFQDHNPFFKKHYSLNIDQMFKIFINISSQIQANIRNNMIFISKLRLYQTKISSILQIDLKDLKLNSEEIIKKYQEIIAEVEKDLEFEESFRNFSENPFKISPNQKIPTKILDLLSVNIGENEDFITFKKSPAFPTNNTIITQRPLIKHNGEYFCFIPRVLFENIRMILEKWIIEKDEHYYNKSFIKKRGKILETYALDLFKKILPKSEIYHDLFYEIVENSETKRAQTDGLVIYDNNLFIIEAKSNILPISARRGSIKNIDDSISEIIDNAYHQAKRTKKFIIESKNPKFEYENGDEAIILYNTDKFENIFLINITLEFLGPLSTQLNLIRSVDYIDGEEWLWSVFINDLKIISDLVESPSIFLLYIKRRLEANEYPQFFTSDEMDYFMYYLENGLYFKDDETLQADVVIPYNLTDKLNRYYDYVAGRIRNADKPIFNTLNEMKELVKKIENLNLEGCTHVSTLLISLSGENHKVIIDKMNEMITVNLSEGKDHDFSLYFNDIQTGITFFICSKRGFSSNLKIEGYKNIKMYQTKAREWIILFIDADISASYSINFKIFKKNWKFNPKMEKILKDLNMNKLD